MTSKADVRDSQGACALPKVPRRMSLRESEGRISDLRDHVGGLHQPEDRVWTAAETNSCFER